MRDIIVWGATGQLIVLNEFAELVGYRIIAACDSNAKLASPIADLPLFHSQETLHAWLSSRDSEEPVGFAVAVGGARGAERVLISEQLSKLGLEPVELIHPSSYVARDASLGQGTQIMAQAVVCARARVGDYALLNTSSSIDHECVLGNGVHIGPGARLAGCVVVGDDTFIGTGAVILPRVSIGKRVIVGAGAVVTGDLPDGVVAYGNPARTETKIS